MEKMLSDDDKRLLDEIYEPREVAVPYSDAWSSLCVTPDGEIRSYGKRPLTDDPDGPAEDVYLASRDCGLSWKLYFADRKAFGPGVVSPWSGRCIKHQWDWDDKTTVGVRITDGDMDSTEYRTVPFDYREGFGRQPIPLFHWHRWIIPTEWVAGPFGHAVLHLSDDDGETWRSVHLPETDHFVQTPPHKGVRWENPGVEPTLVELNSGRLLLFLRTSTDYHYYTVSDDGGETWTKPAPSPFHSTLTMPTLLRLNDGRILFFYNNTRPLPELDKETVFPPLNREEKLGIYEDVFTNRDANCIAISEDQAESWFGFRELMLNGLRNTCDFRSSGSNASGRDKSVHQYQAIELPRGKVLVHVGQHRMVSKLVIFDVRWLYEKERSENFRYGMGGLSTQVYLKSVTGNYRGFTGHCAWNRTNGAVPIPDPCGDHTEVLLLKNTDDDRLFSNAQGIVWNFPAGHRGTVTVRAQIRGEGMRVSVMDHWMNPIDLTVAQYAQFTTVLSRDDAPEWTDLTVRYDTDARTAELQTASRTVKLDLQQPAPNGVCYLHLQTVSDHGDAQGTIIKTLHAVKES